MSFFFYGAINLDNDEATIRPLLTNLMRPWQYDYRRSGQFQYQESLNLAKDRDYLIFDFEDYSARQILTNYQKGDAMLIYFRLIAKQLGIPHWETLELNSHDLVTEVYSKHPNSLAPLIYLLGKILEAFPQKEIVIAIDHELKNRLGCQEVVGDAKQLLLAAWQCIAFGYKPTNMRLRYIPTEKATSG